MIVSFLIIFAYLPITSITSQIRYSQSVVRHCPVLQFQSLHGSIRSYGATENASGKRGTSPQLSIKLAVVQLRITISDYYIVTITHCVVGLRWCPSNAGCAFRRFGGILLIS